MERYVALVQARIDAWCAELPDNGLYAPMSYLLRLPAKRVRPALVLMGCELFGGKVEDALDEAIGIELFHNFTLMHDDIMDAAPLRRGEMTVHAKWNANTAILSGDAMLVKAFQLMDRRPEVRALFSSYALQVCEGQQLDMAFETRDDVRVGEYMEMIRLKTAVLLNCALQAGAAIANAPTKDRELLGAFGEHTGLAFQLRDDLLDAFGDPARTGKQQGGDLRAGKKTWLLIQGLEEERKAGTCTLLTELAKRPEDRDVERMLSALEACGVRALAEAEVMRQQETALAKLDAVSVHHAQKEPLRALAALLLDRAH